MKPTLAEDDFRRELEKRFKQSTEGTLSGREIADAMGVPVSTWTGKVKALIEGGVIEYACKAPRPTIIPGEMKAVPVYRMVRKGGKK